MKALFLVAMDNEERAILATLPPSATTSRCGPFETTVTTLVDGADEVSIAATGIGLTNAAMVTAVTIQLLQPDLVIMLGVAGGLAPDHDVGDVIVASQVVQYDSIYVGSRGVVPMRPGTYLSRNEQLETAFSADRRLVANARARLEKGLSAVREGLMISGSEFSSLPSRKSELSLRHAGALAIDMEASAVMHAASRAGIRSIIIKALSDHASPASGSVLKDFVANVEHACQVSAKAFELLRHNISEL